MAQRMQRLPPVWTNSRPSIRFEAQVQHEISRFQAQITQPGRRQTLPLIHFWPLRVNAEVNVRQRWQHVGIWRSDWESDPSTPSRTGIIDPLDLWPHELSDTPWASASRPYRQFLTEVSLEIEWLVDSMEYTYEQAVVASVPYEQAFGNVRERWIDDGIWMPSWQSVPGNSWWLDGQEHIAPRLEQSISLTYPLEPGPGPVYQQQADPTESYAYPLATQTTLSVESSNHQWREWYPSPQRTESGTERNTGIDFGDPILFAFEDAIPVGEENREHTSSAHATSSTAASAPTPPLWNRRPREHNNTRVRFSV